MDSQRFDAISKLLAVRRSRRDALRAGGAGLAVGALAAASLRDARAQGATPEPVTAIDLLFVQSFRNGTLTPTSEADSTYTLTLTEEQGPTIYFADRPERLWGTMTTERFFTGPVTPFDPADPPNAALMTAADSGHDVTIVTLTAPQFNPATRTATYQVQLVDGEDGENLASLAAGRRGGEPTTTFNQATLFIDNAQGLFDCPDSKAVTCLDAGQSVVGTIDVSYCGTGSGTWCEPCVFKTDPSGALAAQHCNDAFTACKGQCTMADDTCLWPC